MRISQLDQFVAIDLGALEEGVSMLLDDSKTTGGFVTSLILRRTTSHKVTIIETFLDSLEEGLLSDL